MAQSARKRAPKKPSLSIVLPCHNEQEVLADTYAVLLELITRWRKTHISDYEIIMVNNGSLDQTLEVMLELFKKDKKIKVIDLGGNFGYQGSISAGLAHVDKDVAVTIDADLQDDPEKIAEMIERYNEGFELVLGVRDNRGSDSFLKRHFAQLYYRVLARLGVKSVYNHGEFRLMSRRLVGEFNRLKESNRYIRALVLELESRYACVYYERRERRAGTTKFRVREQISLALDGITSFTNLPIRMVLFTGIFMFIMSLVVAVYVLYIKVEGMRDVPGWASLTIIFLFFGGIQGLSIGLLGEYISKMYSEIKARPVFVVRKVYGK